MKKSYELFFFIILIGFIFISGCHQIASCPTVVSTTVFKYFGNSSSNFQIVITFNKNIDPYFNFCLYNNDNWNIIVSNPDRNHSGNNPNSVGILAEVQEISVEGKKIIIKCYIEEIQSVVPTLYYYMGKECATEGSYLFSGLICNPTDANYYAKMVSGYSDIPENAVILGGGWRVPNNTDLVQWELIRGCTIGVEQGNFCCRFSGEDCCIEPICTECEPACPFDSSLENCW